MVEMVEELATQKGNLNAQSHGQCPTKDTLLECERKSNSMSQFQEKRWRKVTRKPGLFELGS